MVKGQQVESFSKSFPEREDHKLTGKERGPVEVALSSVQNRNKMRKSRSQLPNASR